jgi:hypothetical protein
LYDPEQEIADHALSRDSSRRRKRVLDMIIRGPDCSQHDRDALCAVGALNAEPEHGQDAPRNDAEVTEVVAERGSDNDREGDVKSRPDSAIEHHRNRDAGCADNHDGNCVSPVEANSNNARGSLPSPQIDGISSPICHPSPQSPCLILWWDRVHVGIGPHIGRRKSRLLLGELPSFDGGTSCNDGLFAVDVGFDLLLTRYELDHLGGVKTELEEVRN